MKISPSTHLRSPWSFTDVSARRVRTLRLSGIEVMEPRLFLSVNSADGSVITGHVFEDANDDGTFETHEVGIPNVLLTLLDGNGQTVNVALTDENGRYEFDQLEANEYTVVQTQPAGWRNGQIQLGSIATQENAQTGKAAGNQIQAIRLEARQVARDFNFGEYQPATIQGNVHVTQGDGCSEPHTFETSVVEGAILQLLDESGLVIAETVPDQTGAYSFVDLKPGRYGLREITPSPENVVLASGAHGEVKDVTLASNQVARGADFCHRQLATISGRVHIDLNSDCILNPNAGETGVEGIAIQLRNASGQIVATAFTNDMGEYSIANVEPGVYSLVQVEDKELSTIGQFTSGPGSVDAFGEISEITIASAAQLEGYNFCLFDSAATPNTALQNDPPLQVPVDELEPEAHTAEPEQLGNDDSVVILPFRPSLSSIAPRITNTISFDTNSSFAPMLSMIPSAYRPAPPLERLANSRPEAIWQLLVLPDVEKNSPVPTPSPVPELAAGDTLASHSDFVPNDDGQWWQDEANGPSISSEFGPKGTVPMAGDFNGDGIDEIAAFLDGQWRIDHNGNGHWDAEDVWAKLGDADDIPVVGDWDGDGDADVGVFARDSKIRAHGRTTKANSLMAQQAIKRQKASEQHESKGDTRLAESRWQAAKGKLSVSAIDQLLRLGHPTDQPVVGDWNADGRSDFGVFSNGIWRLDTDGNHRLTTADETYRFGQRGDQAFVGDFDGDGTDELAVLRGNQLIIDSNGNHKIDDGDRRIEVPEECTPVIGDFDGDGTDEVATFRKAG